MQMFTQNKFLIREEMEDIKYLISAMRITLHNNYQSKLIMRDYTKEK